MRGYVPTLHRLLAHAPAALTGYLDLSEAPRHGMWSAAPRERISIAVAAANDCSCCLAALTRLARDASVASSEPLAASGVRSTDPANAAGLRFPQMVMESRGHAPEADTATLGDAGFDSAAIVRSPPQSRSPCSPISSTTWGSAQPDFVDRTA